MIVPSRRALVMLAVGLAIVITLALLWRGDHRPAEIEPIAVPAGTVQPHAQLSEIVSREEAPPPEEPTIGTDWKEMPDLPARAQEYFHDCFVVKGGEQRAFADQREKSDPDDYSQRTLKDSIEMLQSSDLGIKLSSPDAYLGLLSASSLIAGNFLRSQVSSQQEWMRRRGRKDYVLPEKDLLLRPLGYSPEMLASYWTAQSAGFEIPARLWGSISLLRDQSLLRYCQLYQQRFHMESCMAQMVLDLQIVIPAEERAEAWSALLPSYRRLSEEMQLASQGYLQQLRTLLASDGLPVAR